MLARIPLSSVSCLWTRIKKRVNPQDGRAEEKHDANFLLVLQMKLIDYRKREKKDINIQHQGTEPLDRSPNRELGALQHVYNAPATISWGTEISHKWNMHPI